MAESKITQEDLDRLADILWWIKGYTAGADAASKPCPFDHDHEETLIKCRLYFLEKKQEKKSADDLVFRPKGKE